VNGGDWRSAAVSHHRVLPGQRAGPV